jgi:hypothetical protein
MDGLNPSIPQGRGSSLQWHEALPAFSATVRLWSGFDVGGDCL